MAAVTTILCLVVYDSCGRAAIDRSGATTRDDGRNLNRQLYYIILSHPVQMMAVTAAVVRDVYGRRMWERKKNELPRIGDNNMKRLDLKK